MTDSEILKEFVCWIKAGQVIYSALLLYGEHPHYRSVRKEMRSNLARISQAADDHMTNTGLLE